MSTQHTSGPWWVGKSFSDGKQKVTPIYAADGSGGTWLIGWLHANATPRHQRQRNAKLIAATPDLLAASVACEKALRMFDRIPSDHAKALLKELRAAIAKATGSAT